MTFLDTTVIVTPLLPETDNVATEVNRLKVKQKARSASLTSQQQNTHLTSPRNKSGHEMLIT